MRFVIDLAIPVVLLLVGVAGKWIMAGGPWEWEYGCLGPDLLLGAFGAELAFLCDVGKRYLAAGSPAMSEADGKRLIFDAFFIVVGVVMLAFAWITHRQPAAAGARRLRRPWGGWRKAWLVGVWNLRGIGMLVGFSLLGKVQ